MSKCNGLKRRNGLTSLNHIHHFISTVKHKFLQSKLDSVVADNEPGPPSRRPWLVSLYLK